MKIKVASIQFNPKPGCVDKNLSKMGRLMSRAVKKGAELIVLPEICDVGYDIRILKKCATTFPNQSTKFFSQFAKSNKVSICAGLMEKRGGKVFNSAVVFSKTGRIIAKYDKAHLFAFPPMVDERKYFDHGTSIVVCKIGNVRIGLAICYDIRFPELYRIMANKGAQIIVNPTAFARSRIETLRICARVRAIENQYFVITSNFCGWIGSYETGGSSQIIAPGGVVLREGSETKEGIVFAEIDLNEIKKVRKERPVFVRRREDLYHKSA